MNHMCKEVLPLLIYVRYTSSVVCCRIKLLLKIFNRHIAIHQPYPLKVLIVNCVSRMEALYYKIVSFFYNTPSFVVPLNTSRGKVCHVCPGSRSAFRHVSGKEVLYDHIILILFQKMKASCFVGDKEPCYRNNIYDSYPRSPLCRDHARLVWKWEADRKETRTGHTEHEKRKRNILKLGPLAYWIAWKIKMLIKKLAYHRWPVYCSVTKGNQDSATTWNLYRNYRSKQYNRRLASSILVCFQKPLEYERKIGV